MLYSLHGTDGAYPYGGLSFDPQGNLYGTAYQGGNNNADCYYGCGTVFKVSPISGGQWTGTLLYAFNGNDGAFPFCNPILDGAGNLYGTTTSDNYGGTVFKLTPGANGKWTETTLYTFNSDEKDGSQPYAGLTFDASGNLYGTTWAGGLPAFAGTVFKLTPGVDGKWTKTTLHSFDNKDGSFVYAGVTFDGAGNLWGTTAGYGSDLGSVYKDGTWAITMLHIFRDMQVNGGVTFDGAGNVYTTSYAGAFAVGVKAPAAGQS